jgi:2'-5' RNA ligase superfamily
VHAPALARIYGEHCADAAERGIPLHVTVLFPFVPLAPSAPFAFELARLEQWPEVLWLAPEPAAPPGALTEAVWGAFPEHPPYEGALDDLIPYATIPEGALDESAADRPHAGLAPLRCRADEVTMLAEATSERWREHERFRLGS